MRVGVRVCASFLVLLCFCSAWAGEYVWSATNTAMADGGFALTLDASSVFYNPAAVGVFDRAVFSAGYGLPYVGFDNSAYRGYLAYLRPINCCYSLGVRGSIEKVSAYRFLRVGGGVSLRFFAAGTLIVALSGDWLQRSYDLPPDEPLASRGPANAISPSFGLLWQTGKRLRLAVSALDFIEPNLALEAGAEGRIPARVVVAAAYEVSPYFSPEAAVLYRSFACGEKGNFDFRLGFCGGLAGGGVRWRAGFNPDEVSLGVGLHTDVIFGGLGIDYAFVLPTASSLRDAGATSHYFGLTLEGRKLRKRRGNIRLQDFYGDAHPKAGRVSVVRAVVANTGAITVGPFSCTLAQNDGSRWRMVYPAAYVDSLAPGDTAVVLWRWRPRKAGQYLLRIAADDDGTKLPDVSGSVDEADEDDNSALFAVDVAPADTIVVEPKFDQVFATQVLVKVEEEPVVPVVFFDSLSADVDSLGDAVIQIIAQRLASNPDALVEVRGYYSSDEASGASASLDSLAFARARAVVRRMMLVAPQIKGRVLVGSEHDPSKPRVISKYSSDDRRVAEENRRVEFFVSVRGKSEWDAPSDDALQVLERNEEFLLVVVGHRLAGESALDALSRASRVRERLLSKRPELARRIVVDDEVAGDTAVILRIDPDGVLYRPRERYPVSEQWRNPEPAENVIFLRREGFDDAVGWELSVATTDGEVSYVIASGRGAPPESVTWNWGIGPSGIIAPQREYRLKLSVETPSGKRDFLSAQTVSLVPRKRIEAVENMLLVEFVFDESEPLSRYLERRLFNFASLFVARADSGYVQSAEIQGHTDDIGSKRRNNKLSTLRAKREFEIMRNYIAFFAKVPLDELDDWLAAHRCELSFKGYADERPYVLRGRLVGDNGSPYGRSINRRVTLEYKYRR